MRYDRHHLIAEGDMVAGHHTMHTVTSSGDDTAHSYASLGLDKAAATD